MVGFKAPNDREAQPHFEREIRNEVKFGHTDDGDPDTQYRMNFSELDQNEVFMRQSLDKFLSDKNPKLDQLQFIGTNLNDFDYPKPTQNIGERMKYTGFGRTTEALFGRNPLDAEPFEWSNKLVFEPERFGVSHDFKQRTTPLVRS